jgi:small subunit ribosomal protein S21
MRRRLNAWLKRRLCFAELRGREFYEPPTAKRKRKKAAAVKRHPKRLRRQMLPKKLYWRVGRNARPVGARPRAFFLKGVRRQAGHDSIRVSNEPCTLPSRHVSPKTLKGLCVPEPREHFGSAATFGCRRSEPKEVDERIELDDAQVLGVIDKLIKQRRDAFGPV